jgi:superoxide dismutase, Cu-Zn family
MKGRTRIGVGLVLATLIALGVGSVLPLEASPNVIRARAILTGPPGSEISGKVLFTESPIDKYSPVSLVSVEAQVQGLTPGLHGFHVHEIGTCDPPAFATAGGHFDPGPFGNSLPVDANHPYHLGDLPQLEANEGGVARLTYETSRFTLRQNAGNLLSIFDANGSAVIVHLNPDLGVNGLTGASGGPRIACGIVEQTAP